MSWTYADLSSHYFSACSVDVRVQGLGAAFPMTVTIQPDTILWWLCAWQFHVPCHLMTPHLVTQ